MVHPPRQLAIAVWLVVCTSGVGLEGAESKGGIAILPPQLQLHGSQAVQRLVVERVAGGRFVGLVEGDEGTVTWSSSDPDVVSIADGVVRPLGNGTATLTASCGDEAATARVEVAGMEEPQVWEFRRHVLPVLSKVGCNSGACHGALAGKGGFKLSLRGYNPAGDYFAITREARGRRVELSDPGRSLFLAKPSAALPHKGGLRLDSRSRNYQVLAGWIAGGAPAPAPSDPRLESIRVLPDHATLQVGQRQPLVVQAQYSDGRLDDVTHWARFSSTSEAVAKVDDDGVVTIVGPGEGAIVTWFSSQIVLARMTVPYANELHPAVFVEAPRRNFIDQLSLEKLASLRLAPSPRGGDAEFLRRVYLDTIGTLPTASEVERFLADARADKRDRVIDHLLARPEFTDYWTYKWSDVLLVNSRRLRPQAVNAYYQWIRGHVSRNTPWDVVVREVITATGETVASGATNFYSLHQSPEEMTENVCQAFLSLSIGCAKCHNHPLEKWTNDQYYAMASHFARVRAKGWGGDPRSGDGLRTLFLAGAGELIQPLTGQPQPPTPLDGDPLPLDAQGDRRVHLAQWLTAPSNPYFSRAIANRIWANFFGVGLVEPVDDLRLSNPASNDQLLAALADYLVSQGFDLKSLMRIIVQSETYQRTSEPLPTNQDDRRFYSRYYPRRLPAEVLLDAIAQVSEVPTKFTQIGYDGNDFSDTTEYPLGTRAIQLRDSAVVSNFLKTFGRNERDITCECERSSTPSMVQVLHINNGVTINDRLAARESCVARAIPRTDVAAVINDAYLRTLSRTPTESERTALLELISADDQSARGELLEDLYWSILSSREFLFNH
jgi:hypothetical protein